MVKQDGKLRPSSIVAFLDKISQQEAQSFCEQSGRLWASTCKIVVIMFYVQYMLSLSRWLDIKFLMIQMLEHKTKEHTGQHK
jgi:hypothetical protein